MRSETLAVTFVLACSAVVAAQPPPTSKYRLGRTPTPAELSPRDAHVPPSGDGLPTGSGTAKRGEIVYQTRGCGSCHGPTGEEGPGPVLVGSLRRRAPSGHGDHAAENHWPGRGVKNFPFASILWSWINVGMPLHQQGYLTPDEVYSLTAYLLHRNGIIKEDEVMDAESLVKVQMPKRADYVPPPFADWTPGLRGR